MNEDKASRYHRLKRWARCASIGWSLVLLGGLLATGLNASLRNVAEAAALLAHVKSGHASATVCGFVVLLFLLHELGALPIEWWGHRLERRYGQSNETAGRWLADQAKALVIAVALGGGGVIVIYGFIRSSPEGWWLPAGAIFALLMVGFTNLAPVLLLPLFYVIKPLNRDVLRHRLLALAGRAGAQVLGVYEWGLGEKTQKANAALTGLGATRRILVSDTMLAGFSDDEIEVVLAHELAHHVHGDIWKGVAFESALLLAGFYLASRVLLALAAPFGLRGASDVAGLPLLLLALGAVSLAMAPIAHAMSRGFERRADRFALALTCKPDAFVSAMRRLGAQNLAEETPSRIVQWLFYSHPPLRERIAAAEAFKA